MYLPCKAIATESIPPSPPKLCTVVTGGVVSEIPFQHPQLVMYLQSLTSDYAFL